MLVFLLVGTSAWTGEHLPVERPSDKGDYHIEVVSPNLPVLIGTEFNVLLRISIPILSGNTSALVSQFELHVEGASDLTGFEKFEIFSTGGDSIFSPSTLFGTITDVGADKFSIDGTSIVTTGANYFWLSCTVNPKTPWWDAFLVNCRNVLIDRKVNSVSQKSHGKKELGIALRKHNDDLIDTYRIPGLVTTIKGTLIGVYDTRKNSSVDLQEDINIGMSRSTDGGNSWAKMKVIVDMGEWGGRPQIENGIGDPSILVDQNTNTIWVAGIWAHGHPGERNWYASQPGISPEETSQLVLVKSEDDGITWSKPINITTQIKNPSWHLLLQGPGKGIMLKNGTLVFPAQFKDDNEVPHSTIIFSTDHGINWKIGKGAKSHTTEAQVVELRDGSLMLNMRDDRGGYRSVMTSQDLGMSWQEHPSSRRLLPEPICMASLIKHTYSEHDIRKEVLIFSNPADSLDRQNMTIKLSFDEGMSWPEQYHTMIDEGMGRGYSCLTSIDENTIGILYEGSQADLVFQKFTLADLMKK
jgi:sialidase-1